MTIEPRNDAEAGQVPQETVARDAALRAGEPSLVKLGQGARGLRGVVAVVSPRNGDARDPYAAELEKRLLEIGFVEGARVEILHEGFIGRDPIAVKVDDMRVAIRRKEADAILVRVDAPKPGAR